MEGLITFVARDLIYLSVIALFFILWRLRGMKRRDFILSAMTMGALTFLLANTASLIYYNPRPFLSDGVDPLFVSETDNGFPSIHTLLAAFVGLTTLNYSLRWGVGLLVIALLIGWARVAAGVHHLVDVCGSFVVAGLAYLVVYYAQKRLLRRRTRPKRHKA